MDGPRRDIMMLVRNEFIGQEAIENELECLNGILYQTESPRQFCIAHELIDRNKITSNTSKLLRNYLKEDPGPFRFFICKN